MLTLYAYYEEDVGALFHSTRLPNRLPEFESFLAVFVTTKTGYVSQEVEPSPSMNLATQSGYFKPNHDAFLTFTKCFFVP